MYTFGGGMPVVGIHGRLVEGDTLQSHAFGDLEQRIVHLFGEGHLVDHRAVLTHQDGRTACIGIARERRHLHEVVGRAIVLLANDLAVGGEQNIGVRKEQTAIGGDFLQSRIGRIGETLADDTEHQIAKIEGLVGVVVEFHIIHTWGDGIEEDFINEDLAFGDVVRDAELHTGIGFNGCAHAVGYTIN